MKITIENLKITKQKNLERMRDFQKALKKISNKYLIPIIESEDTPKEIGYLFAHFIFEGLQFNAKYEFDSIMIRDYLKKILKSKSRNKENV